MLLTGLPRLFLFGRSEAGGQPVETVIGACDLAIDELEALGDGPEMVRRRAHRAACPLNRKKLKKTTRS